MRPHIKTVTMCGIFACLYCDKGINSQLKEEIISKLKRRGPDEINEVTLNVGGSSLRLNLIGSLLRMRGDSTPQPHPLPGTSDHLLWNGNVFGGKIKIPDGYNDTMILGEELVACERGGAGGVASPLVTMGAVHGPWAFVYWQNSTQSLWFGRDVFGRRSLLWHTPSQDDPLFALCSVGHYNETDMPLGYWKEVPANGIYQLKCHGPDLHRGGELICYPWMQGDEMFQTETTVLEDMTSLATTLSTHVKVEKCLQIPFPPLNKDTPTTHYKTTGKDNTSTTENVAGIDSAQHSKEASEIESSLSLNVDWSLLSQQLLESLQTAVQVRVSSAPPVAANSSTASVSSEGGDTSIVMREGRARLAILYSGGVDSTVLAALADRCLPQKEEIDLINVAFEQQSAPIENRFSVPDRVAALESLKELNPERQWNLVQVNVTLEEVKEMRRCRVSHMVYPNCTVLDDSIGCALWFAARGVGLLHPHHTLYHSQARTLFIGIGADEQLGGYSRHRTRFNSAGWSGLTEELDMEIKRLARRNLGRDDRCVADHEREGQFPFLDETVVSFLQSLPSWQKTDFSLPRGEGEKRLLREVAALLGCHSASRLPKRAIQFGSRMAKLSGSSGGREQGSHVTERILPGTKY